MSGDGADAAQYAYRPSLMGAPCEFRLGEGGLDWRAGRSGGHIPWARFRRVRMSFRPTNMQMHRFLTELWAEGEPKLTIASTSAKSMFEQERLDRPYSDFVTALHRELARASVMPLCEQGTAAWRYWPGLVIFAGVSLGVAALCVRALHDGAAGAALFIAAFLALFLWRGGEYFRRNRPRLYTTDALPPELLPK